MKASLHELLDMQMNSKGTRKEKTLEKDGKSSTIISGAVSGARNPYGEKPKNMQKDIMV